MDKIQLTKYIQKQIKILVFRKALPKDCSRNSPWSDSSQETFFCFLSNWVVVVFKVGNGTFENVNFGIEVSSKAFHDNDIGKEGGKLSIKLHVMISDFVKHSREQFHALKLV